MAIQKKHGKGRLDKWYRLAKEKGYRARAAFKLIQLNKKYGFLEKSKVLLDLCAAPGSWCQVAAECMPTQSIIVGVDLAPIKPIPRVITFQSDITTEKCRATIRQHLKHWKADTVLHDGAPNVGTAWVQDAFSQAELVLQSMKLATEFLVEGGTFVTKVFRSKDYNPLLWVFKQLFTSVEATKPPSSRNVSAEIFVVCRGFKAPKRIDPKFLDPKHVFAELTDATPNNEARVFNPEKKKRKREGYEEGDYTQFKEIPVTEFINTTDPIAILGTYNKLSFQQSPGGDLALATLNRLEETTDEIRTCCEDLKILGKKEFRNLLRWRLKVREKFGLVVKKGQSKTDEPEEVAEVAPMDEELAIQEELQRLQEKESSKRKKERRKENEKKRKEIVRMQMHMTTPMDIGMEQLGPGGDDATFSLKRVERDGARDVIASGKVAEIESDSEDDQTESDDNESDDEGDQLERELDSLYEQYQERREDRDSKVRAKKARKDYEADEWDGFSDSDKEDDEESEEEGASQAAVKPAPPNSGTLSSKAAMFFDQDIFQDLGDVDDVEDEDSAIEMQEDDRSAKKESASEKQAPKDAKKNTQATEDFSDSEPEELDDPRKKNGQLDIDIITAEAMALAQQMATGEKKSQDIVDDGFNRYAFRDVDGLPEWFLDDENKHSKLQRPITKAAAAAIKEKLRAINARPIKKVMEAKGRKKMKAAQRLEKLRKKSALLADDEALSERDKSQAIAKLMSKAVKKKPKQQVKLVVAKGANRGISGRPRGVKGKYKIVDSRMKKDLRAQKRLAKKKK
ncbi:adoMet-dependent rRNA methyltransferase spb1 [Aspergillus udagawae]|uniref:AdoMet-dependent rRNA methyltransferase spb1 n=1 Tax=Aspergillus udagawae TaxID=91492 RepID=A0A8H3NXG5_9EURO|nr:AdoMet-dependent rRNA methyltransferase spb1 [Aspergillus udagawae]GFF40936.1 adoMet-dependent rRNA methyltransferase spb1 [Aspergillus udagawae]GFF41482.1 adoMet-dependent rRNA methyltransferase spb1 [Aspergillus udagawae]GFF99803.1 adoMet-dependent rRNA methyltransferase spb1 [Aspergillus udagawae]GFG19175.1 adoMet-dependent rRNA methyltransferase spb1 [Aspergillus udagawae]GFG20928.1 adoMet-dependent rRNA methyltransferase spb1 [Aspergillus udagawae]